MAERDLPTITDSLWADLLLDDPNASAGETSPSDAVRTVTSLYSAPTPGAARERARQRVFHVDSIAQENTMSALPIPIPSPGWPVPAVHPQKPARRTIDRRWALLSAAAVLILLLGGLGSFFFGYDRFFGGQETHYAAIPAATPTADWPMYRGNPGRTGESAGYGPVGQPKELWKVHIGASASRSPAIVAGVAYAGSADGNMYALDAMTGEERWTFQADSGVEITPTVDDGIVYFPSEFGTLYALDASTGEQIWTFDQAISPTATPIVTSGLLFVGADSGTYYALDAKTGDERWHFDTGEAISRSAAFADGVIYTGSEDGNLYALDAANGGELWRFATGADVVGTPSVANGQVYTALPSGDGLSVLDARTGLLKFELHDPANGGMSPAAISGNGVFVGGKESQTMNRFDATTGDLVWSYPTGELMGSVPAIVDGVVYAGGTGTEIMALDAETGDLLWQFSVDGGIDYGPSVANGVVYVGTLAGTFYAIGGFGPATPEASAVVASASPEASAAVATFLWQSDGGENGWIVGDLAMLPDGNIAAVGNGVNDVVVLSPDGDVVEKWTPSTTVPNVDNLLESIAVDSDGNIYLGSAYRATVEVFAPDHTLLRSWGSKGTGDGQFQYVGGIGIAPNGDVWVVDGELVQVFDAEGNFLKKIGEPGSGPGQFASPGFPFFDADGNVWISDFRNSRVTVWSPDGTFIRAFGEFGRRPGQWDEPNSVDLDGNGLAFIPDTELGHINVYTTDGQFVAQWGEKGSQPGQFYLPSNTLLDGQGNIYVSELDGGRIQKFALNMDALAVLAAAAGTPIA